MRVLVSGVGRSATTMLYRQIGHMIRNAFAAPRYRYEPYLWRINAGSPADASFGPGDLSPFGMYAHRASPLFLDGRHPVHDAFIEDVFGKRPTMEGDPEKPDAWLVKIIRGSGRLESYLKSIPDLKIVICLRNPIDTLNSSLGMFSFTGEEFHESDAPRLVREVRQHCTHIDAQNAETASHLALSATWWRACTEWSLKAAARYPKRCHIFRHEAFVLDREAEIEKLASFLGFSSPVAFKVGLAKSAGQKIATRHLLNSDLAEMEAQLAYYLEVCLAPVMTTAQREDLRQRIWRQNGEGDFFPQIAADRLGRRSTLQLRREILARHDAPARYTKPGAHDTLRIPLPDHVKAHCRSQKVSVGSYKIFSPVAATRRREFTFGCCITSFNNRDTIRDAVFSALDQTMPFDHIVIVDDASTDGSQAVLAELEGRYSSLSIVYKKHNGGVSAARNTGLARLGTSFLTQLDGDDCFWPTKNRAEAEVLFDDPEVVAFSQTLMDGGALGTTLAPYPRYAAGTEGVFENLLSRVEPLPREMTFAAQHFHAAGGYEVRSPPLYEDWDFKLRLARTSPVWRRSDADVGTVYNRRNSRLSGASDWEHVRGLIYVFAKTAIANPDFSGLARCFAKAIAPRRYHIPRKIYAMLEQIDSGELDVSVLKPFTSRSWAVAKSTMDGNAPHGFLAEGTQEGDLEWQPISGFAVAELQLPSVDRPRLRWIAQQQSAISLKIRRQVLGLEIEVFNPVATTRIEVEARNGAAMAFSRSFDVPLGQTRGRWLGPKVLSISCIIQPGDYELVLRLRPPHEDVSRLWQMESNRMHLAISDIRSATEGTPG